VSRGARGCALRNVAYRSRAEGVELTPCTARGPT
jgi:hypothetical protein